MAEHAPTYDLRRLVARSAPTYARPYEKFCYRTIIRMACRAIHCNRSPNQSLHAIIILYLTKYSRSVVCTSNRQKSHDQKIVRSGVTKALRLNLNSTALLRRSNAKGNLIYLYCNRPNIKALPRDGFRRGFLSEASTILSQRGDGAWGRGVPGRGGVPWRGASRGVGTAVE